MFHSYLLSIFTIVLAGHVSNSKAESILDHVAQGRLKATAMYGNGKKNVLVIVDTQFDFLDPTGALSVFTSDSNSGLGIPLSEYIARVNAFLKGALPTASSRTSIFDLVVFSMDTHPRYHCSFASVNKWQGCEVTKPCALSQEDGPWCPQRKAGNFMQVMWPDHCLEGEVGATYYRHLSVIGAPSKASRVPHFSQDFAFYGVGQKPDPVAPETPTLIIYKGMDPRVDSYSAFADNAGKTTGLGEWLGKHGFGPSQANLWVYGVAADFCVGYTILDGAERGYEVGFMFDLSPGVIVQVKGPFDVDAFASPTTVQQVLKNDRVAVVHSSEVLDGLKTKRSGGRRLQGEPCVCEEPAMGTNRVFQSGSHEDCSCQ